MKPSIGRIVHYVGTKTDGFEGRHVPAIIVDVRDTIIEVQPFVPALLARPVLPVLPDFSDGHEPGTWHWPEREEP